MTYATRDFPRFAIPAPAAAIMGLAFLSIVNFLSYADRILIAALASPIQREFQITDSQFGLLSGLVFALCYSAMALPIGRWADSGSRKTVLALAITLWSVLTMLSGMAQSFTHLLIARMGIGIGEAACLPVAYSIIRDSFAPARRGLALGIFTAASVLGTTAGLALGGILASMAGWRAAFLVLGLPGCLAAIWCVAIFRDPPRRDSGTAAAPPIGAVFLTLLRNRIYVLLVAGAAMNSYFTVGMVQWLPLFFIRSHHLSSEAAGILFGGAIGGGMAAGLVVGGWWGDRLAKTSEARALHIAIAGGLLTPIVYALVLWSPDVDAALTATFIGAFLSAMVSPPIVTALLNNVGSGVAATASAVMMVVATIVAVAIVPFAVGFTSDLLTPAFGEEALRYALMPSLIVGFVAAGTFNLARMAMIAKPSDRQETE